MARIRSIKPEFCASEQVSDCSPNARLLFILMWCFCDDNGVHQDSPKRLKMEVFPADDFTVADVAAMVDELVAVGLLERYQVSGASYLRVTGWHKHQRIDQPNYRHPLPDGTVPERPARRGNGNTGGAQRTNGERAMDERRTRQERRPTVRRTVDERSPPEWSGEERKGKEDVDDARAHVAPSASPPAPPDHQPSEAVRIGNLVTEVMGVHEDPRWFGDFHRVSAWLTWGADEELILLTIRRVMANRTETGPPNTLKYFDKAIVAALADRDAPMPKTPEVSSHGQRPDHHHRANAVDAMLAGFAQAADDRSRPIDVQ